MSLGLSRRATALSNLALGALAAPMLLSSPASADVGLLGPCDVSVSGSTISLNRDCTTSVQITVPTGTTVDGKGFTITAVNPSGGHFTGGVLAATVGSPSTPTTLNVKNLTITAVLPAYAGTTSLSGIRMENAGGTITNVTLNAITTSSGAGTGRALEVRNGAATTAPTLAIDGLTIRNYEKSGVFIQGLTNFTATNMDIGRAGNTDGSPWIQGASNGFTVFGGGSGTITNSTIAGNRYAGDDNGATGDPSITSAILVIDSPQVTISGVTVNGTDSDNGLYASNNASAPSTVTITCSSLTRTAGGNADTTYGSAILNDNDGTSTGTQTLVAGSNTFSGWTRNTEGAVTATTDPTCPVVTPAPVPPAVATVAVHTNKPKPRKGKKFTISGSANPALAGVAVTLQRKFGKEYRAVASSTLPADGAISFTKKTNKRGNKFYRVVVGSGPAYAGGTSNVVKIHTR